MSRSRLVCDDTKTLVDNSSVAVYFIPGTPEYIVLDRQRQDFRLNILLLVWKSLDVCYVEELLIERCSAYMS